MLIALKAHVLGACSCLVIVCLMKIAVDTLIVGYLVTLVLSWDSQQVFELLLSFLVRATANTAWFAHYAAAVPFQAGKGPLLPVWALKNVIGFIVRPLEVKTDIAWPVSKNCLGLNPSYGGGGGAPISIHRHWESRRRKMSLQTGIATITMCVC